MEREPTFIPKEDKFQNTIAFLRKALDEGAHLKIPLFKRNGRISEDQWARQKNILGIYFGSPAVLEDIARMYGVTREMIRTIKNRGMRNLWSICSSETQALFPLEELALDKPMNQKSRERHSVSRGGISVTVNKELQAGKSIEEMRRNGLSIGQIAHSRYTLRQWGVDVPYLITPHSQNLELEKNLKNAKRDKEKQELLNQVAFDFHENHTQGTDPLLASVSNIFREDGFTEGFHHQNFTFLLASLKNAGFPIGELQRNAKIGGKEVVLKYHFTLAKDKERAKQILLSDPNLQRFRRY